MLKKALIVLVVAALIIGGAVWYALANARTLIAALKPQIESAASSAVGAPVAFGELDVSIFPSTQLNVDTVSIGGPGALSLKDLALHLDLWALLKKKLSITELSLAEPNITLVKDSAGVSIEGLPKNSSAGAAGAPQTAPSAAPTQGAAPLDIQLHRLELSNASLTFRDLTTKTEQKITAINLSAAVDVAGATVRVPDLKLSALVNGGLKVSASARDATLDQGRSELVVPAAAVSAAGISVNLNVKMNLKAGSGDVALSSPGIELEKLKGLGSLVPPAVTALKLQGSVQPNLQVTLLPQKSLIAGTIGLKDAALTQGALAVSALNATIDLKGSPGEQAATINNLALKINGEPITGSAKGAMRGRSAQLHDLSLNAFGGKIGARGSHDTAAQNFSFQVDLADVEIGKLIAAAKPGTPAALSGKLFRGTTTLSGQAGPALMTSLKGTGSIAVRDAKLAGQNIGGKVLKSAVNLPFLSGALYESVPPETRKALDANETVISSLDSSFSIAQGAITTKDLKLRSSLFDVAASGSASFAGALDLGATITFEKGLSGSIAGKVKEIRPALDKDGRLAVPLTIKGAAPNLSVMPDFTKLLSGSVGKVIEQKAGDALNRLLGGKKSSGKGLGGVLGF